MDDRIEETGSFQGRKEPETSGATMSPLWVVVFYGVLSIIAYAWSWWSDGVGELLWVSAHGFWVDAGLGVGVGIGLVVITRIVRRFSAAAQALEEELRAALGKLSLFEIALYAACSGIGEEALFRGAMQEEWGIVLASLVFGFIHGGFRGKLWLWSVFALAVGFILGGVMLYTSALLAPVLAHATVNLLNLHALSHSEPA